MKSVARDEAKTLRSSVYRRISAQTSVKINDYLVDFIKNKAGFEVIAVYLPIQTEIDIRPIVPKLRQLGKVLCLPVIVADNKPLQFNIWHSNSTLVEKKFRVLVPTSTEIVEPDLILCPLLRFDLNGYRLGYGGGFYDRTIDNLAKKKSIFSLGCAYSEQISKKMLPIGKFDKPMNAVVTENGLTFFNGL
tara:strand:- start:56 stop:625 length:570 start_codon:yes stop_codon:yes gene_type:complete